METRPFEDLISLVNQLPKSQASSTKDGGLVEVEKWLSSAQNQPTPKLTDMHICILASAYAKPVEGVHLDQQGQLDIEGFIASAGKGAAPVNDLCKTRGLGLRVLELAPSLPHFVGVWSEADCVAAVAFGMEATAAGGDLLCLSSICHWDEYYAQIFLNRIINSQIVTDEKESKTLIKYLKILQDFGGRDIAASLGAMIAARSRQLPVIIEGWAALCAYALLAKIAPQCTDHIVLGAIQNRAQTEWVSNMDINAPIVGVEVAAGAGCGVAHAATLVAAVVSQ